MQQGSGVSSQRCAHLDLLLCRVPPSLPSSSLPPKHFCKKRCGYDKVFFRVEGRTEQCNLSRSVQQTLIVARSRAAFAQFVKEQEEICSARQLKRRAEGLVEEGRLAKNKSGDIPCIKREKTLPLLRRDLPDGLLCFGYHHASREHRTPQAE
jgi:hypothetical protein